MADRFNTRSQSRLGVEGLPSGYDTKSSPTDITLPPCGIVDVDRSLFKLFDKEIPFQVSDGGDNTRKVPVLFNSGEKWALLKKQREVRDRNNSLILPIITIMRTTIEQSPSDDVTGRGTNQQTGEIIIRRRLDESDRRYQNLINRALLLHQSNVAVHQAQADVGQLTTLDAVGDLSDTPDVLAGGLLAPNRLKNVYETIVVPTPQFYTATYDVTFWTQFDVHMNQLMEQLVSSFLPQGNAWRLDTPKGYWFIATVLNNSYEVENNADDMSAQERFLKMKFTIKVPAYVLATKVSGAPIPLKRYVSAPVISFDVGAASENSQSVVGLDDPYLGADDPTLPLSDNASRRRDQRRTNDTRLYPNPSVTSPDDPALANVPRGQQGAKYKKVTITDSLGNVTVKFIRVTNVNKFSGETVFSSGFDLGSSSITVTDDLE